MMYPDTCEILKKKYPELCSVIEETVRMEEMKIDILGVYFIEIKVIKLHLPVQ